MNFDWRQSKSGSRSLVGTVKNHTSKTYSYVQVQFNLYDKSGAQVGSALANVTNLGPNGTWKFEAEVLYDNAVKAGVAKVTAF